MRCPGDRTRPEGSASSGVIISTPVAVEVGGLLPVVVVGGGGGGGGGGKKEGGGGVGGRRGVGTKEN